MHRTQLLFQSLETGLQVIPDESCSATVMGWGMSQKLCRLAAC
jgi:hypothetical protein